MASEFLQKVYWLKDQVTENGERFYILWAQIVSVAEQADRAPVHVDLAVIISCQQHHVEGVTNFEREEGYLAFFLKPLIVSSAISDDKALKKLFKGFKLENLGNLSARHVDPQMQ